MQMLYKGGILFLRKKRYLREAFERSGFWQFLRVPFHVLFLEDKYV